MLSSQLVLADNALNIKNSSEDSNLIIDTYGNITGKGNMTFNNSNNGYGFFRVLGDKLNEISEVWVTSLFVSGNATVNGTIIGRDYPQSTLLSCNFDGSYTCDGGESGSLTTGFDGLWHMEEGTGDAFDDSDNVYHAVLRGNAAWTANGKYGSAVEFEGIVGDHLDTNTQLLLAGTGAGFSFGAWAYMKGASTSILGNDTEGLMGNSNDGFILKWGTKIACQGYTEGSPTCYFEAKGEGATPHVSVPKDEWFHVVGVLNTTDVAIFINGELEGYTTAAGSYVVSTSDFTIGQGEWNAFTGYWNGTIDEAFFTNQVLEAGEIKILSESRWSDTSFVDSNKGDFDRSYYAQEHNNLTYPTAGNINNESGSISLWVKNGWDGTDGLWHNFFSMGNGTGLGVSTNEYRIWKHTNNQLYFSIEDEGSVAYHLGNTMTAGEFDANEWHHIVATWNGAGRRELYLNGVSKNTNTNAGATIIYIPDNMHIGNTHWGTAYPAQSLFDDFQIFNRVLTNEEVIDLYQVGSRNKSVTDNFPHWENNIFSAYTNANSATFTTVAIELLFDTVIRKNSLYVHSTVGTDDTDINIRKTGEYMLNFDCSLDVSVGAARSVGRCYPTLNNVEIDGARCFDYARTAGNGDQTCSVNRVISLERGDVVSAAVIRHTGGDTLIATADGSRITLEFLG